MSPSLRRVLVPFALSLLLIACGDRAPPVESVASPSPSTPITAEPAPPPAAAPMSVVDTVEANTNEVAGAAAVLETDASPPVSLGLTPEPIPGLLLGGDYDIINNGQRFSPGDGVEVAEVFAYWCAGCAQFQPLIDAWKARLPAGVNFVYVPMVGAQPDAFPSAFYAIEATGLTARAHAAIYQAVHVERRLRPRASMDEIAAFLATDGLAAQDLKSTMESFAVNANLGRARQFAIRNGVTGTPMLIINGQYRVNGRNREEQLRIADQIIAHLHGRV